MEQASAPGLASLALLSLGSACLAAVSTYALFWGAAEGRTLRSTQVVQDSGHRHNAKGQGHDRCTVEADQRGQDTQPRQTDQRKGCDACHCLESKRADPRDPQPRTGYLTWDEYFMSLAFLSAQRSKDPNKQVGAVIVGANKVVLGIGYNGFPRGCPDEQLPWAKLPPKGSSDPLDTKYPYVVHAEANALLNTNTATIQGATIYVTMFPCNECAKLLIQAGIREVVYHEGKVGEDACVAKRPGNALPDHHYGVALSSAHSAPQPPTHTSNPTPLTTNSTINTNGQQTVTSRESSSSGSEEDGSGGMQAIAGAAACYLASQRLLHMAGVRLRQHKLSRKVVLQGPA